MNIYKLTTKFKAIGWAEEETEEWFLNKKTALDYFRVHKNVAGMSINEMIDYWEIELIVYEYEVYVPLNRTMEDAKILKSYLYPKNN